MKIEILIRYLNGETSEEENIRINEWCQQSSSNQMELETLQLIWNSAATDEEYTPPDSATSLAKLKLKAGLRNEKATVVNKSFTLGTWIKVAAVLAPLPLLIWFLILQYRTIPELTAQTVAKTDTTFLADGSLVILNRNSMLKYPETFHHIRTVSLTKGEAFFNIKHDRARPFIVLVNGIKIRVVGTSFNVKISEGKTEVIVETGKVQVTSKREHILLLPAESISIGGDSRQLQKQKHPDLLYTYYRYKEFKANGTPLWRLAEVLQEAYDVQIHIQNDNIKNLPLSTTFKEEALEDILNVLAKTFNITINKKGNQIIIN